MTATSARHIVLMGDSIFDNHSYVRYGPEGKSNDVITHIKNRIKENNSNDNATLIAVDGNVIKDVSRQIKKIPKDSTHIFLSIGGNDALRAMYTLDQKVNSVGEALLTIYGSAFKTFQTEYRSMLDQIQKEAPDANLTLCLIYNPRYEDEKMKIMTKVGLASLNDLIIQEAVQRKLPVIDLRSMFNEYDDYANSIEPSHQGGQKISICIMNIVQNHDFKRPTTTLYV
ncbi:ypmR [Acrasis kona]|uniref:YpmR n=1 Tax=Acrasis kona TaxID=1008807 RepID=A0AAW2YVS5_9EUKA